MAVVIGVIVAVILLLILWSFLKTVIWLGVVSVVLFGAGWLIGYSQGSNRGSE
ncbi:MAG TPA: hypothetical protein VFO84_10685 [Dehalococcoidia bacterium]|nr:hypothetical protein [Dehalococcoidia bacterium]